jgi:hypothetical protein
VLIVPLLYCSNTLDPASQLVVEQHFFDGAHRGQLAFYSKVSTPCLLTIDLTVIGLSALTYAVVVWCSVRIWLHMRHSFGLVSDAALAAKARSMAVQINVVLLVQAVTPLCLELAPTSFLACAALAKMPTGTASSSMTLFLNWAPIINAASVIVIVRPYREAVFAAIRKRVRGRGSSVSGVHALSGSHGHSRT